MSVQNQPKATILVVDDDTAVRSGLRWLLDERYKVLEAASRSEAVELMRREKIDAVLSDLRLPPFPEEITEGLSIVAEARALRPPIPVIVITASDSRNSALEAVRRGASSFFEKPFDHDAILHTVAQTVNMHRLEEEVLLLRSQLSASRGFGHMIGASPALDPILRQARSVAATSATVLITGESGTGKELLARAIHEESARSAAPFIAVSCAALPESLIESELFGHEKGSFTGATQARRGRFELADSGTLFLDEIGELTQVVQVKLLRVLQERSFERIGSTKTQHVDIRLIAASNRDLEEEVAAGRFRQDLFYRLNVVPLTLPPLRTRHEDIPLLAAHFAEKTADKHGRRRPELEPALVEALQDYEWPGNVRELENLIERLVVLTREPRLTTEYLPERMLRTTKGNPSPGETTLEGAVDALKRRLIESALQSEGGNKVAAARRLGISRSYLHRLINDFGMG
jgi:two-component system, NtrC family, response regulator HydG